MNFESTNDKKVNNFIFVIDRINDFALLFVLCVLTSHNSLVEGQNYAYYIAFFLYIGVSLFRAITHSYFNLFHFKIPIQTIWYGLFILMCLCSLLWAKYPSYTSDVMSKLVQNLVLSYFMIINVEDRIDYEKLQNIFILSVIYMTIRILFFSNIKSIFSSHLGNYNITGHNVNLTASYYAFVIIIVFYRFYSEKKYLYVFLIALFSFMLLLTSSRKAIFMVVLSIVIMIFLDRKKKNKVLSLIITFLVIAIVMYFVFTNEKLYSAVGKKIESMLLNYEKNSADKSLIERRFFRKYAIELFTKHPIFGTGINNYGGYLKEVFTRSTYSHNNWLEMLSGLGVVGFITYYWFYGYLIVQSAKLLKKYNYVVLALTFILSLTITEYALITYYDSFIQLFISLCFIEICVAAKEDKLSENIGIGGTEIE